MVMSPEERKEKKRLHYIKNREKILAQKKVYYQENGEHMKEQMRAYKQDHKGDCYKTHVKRHMTITNDQLESHMAATHCNICDISFEFNKKHADHDHTTGLFRGSVCNRCNVHLLRKYDELQEEFTTYMASKECDPSRVLEYISNSQ